MKEFRAYVCLFKKRPFPMSPSDIDSWSDYEKRHNKLSEDAEKFVAHCEGEGDVYSLQVLQNSLNFGGVDSSEVFIYITNNY